MAVTSFYSVRKRLLGQRAALRQDYLHDALGSVTATSNSSGTIQNRYRYKPYGTRLSKDGSAPDPQFQWVGCAGYRIGGASAPYYVRTRHLNVRTANWASVDRVEFPNHPYVYAAARPTYYIDPQGSYPVLRPLGQGPPQLSSQQLADLPRCQGRDINESWGYFRKCRIAPSGKTYSTLNALYDLSDPTKPPDPLKQLGVMCHPVSDCECIKRRIAWIDQNVLAASAPPQSISRFKPWAVTCCCREDSGALGVRIWYAIPYEKKGEQWITKDERYPECFCTWKCIFDHEKKHRERYLSGIDSCFETDQNKILASERAGYTAEKECLEKLLKDAGIDPSKDCPKTTCSV